MTRSYAVIAHSDDVVVPAEHRHNAAALSDAVSVPTLVIPPAAGDRDRKDAPTVVFCMAGASVRKRRLRSRGRFRQLGCWRRKAALH